MTPPVSTARNPAPIDPAAPLQFVINAASGQHKPATTRQVIEEALRLHCRTGELLFAPPDELSNIAQQAAATAFGQRGAVVAVGGDGTVNAVAQAAHAQVCAMGVLPQGTFNYFARTHGIPVDAPQALHTLLTCAPMPVLVGLFNDHVFLVNASLGLYPELLQDREAYKNTLWPQQDGGIWFCSGHHAGRGAPRSSATHRVWHQQPQHQHNDPFYWQQPPAA